MKTNAMIRQPVSPVRMRVAVGGDVCPGPLGAALAREGRAAGVFAPLAPILSDADLRIVQFETPLVADGKASPIPKSGPNLISAPESADVVRGAFDVALLANNHIGDQGPQGVMDSIRELRSRGVATVGAGANAEEASAPLRLEAAGRPVSIMNFAEFEFGIAGKDTPGAAPQRPADNMRAVAAEAVAGRTVIVVLHGGHEFFPFPSPRLRDLCRAFAEASASLVVNCHEHCPQGVEWHKGVPIVYSPGNLWFPPDDPSVPADDHVLWDYGYIAKVSFDDFGPFELELLPVRQGHEEVRPLEGAARAGFDEYIGQLSGPLSDSARLQALFEAWCAESGRQYLDWALSALPEGVGARRGRAMRVPHDAQPLHMRVAPRPCKVLPAASGRRAACCGRTTSARNHGIAEPRLREIGARQKEKQ